MIEVILTCLLFSASTYTPPAPWTVVDVTLDDPRNIKLQDRNIICSRGNHLWGECPAERGSIRLRRTFTPGDKIKLPNDCTMETKKP